ncbi:MAG: alginate export family protein [Bacteroidales bacterium]|nr:alginate export family protein [Bacteroidales bacterium]
MKIKNILALAMLLLAGSTLYAQVKISAEVRPRTEYSHGSKSLATEDTDGSMITSQRTRLNLDFKNEDFAVGVVMQDVRNWGQESQLTSNGNNVVYLHQAWAEWFIDPKFSLKAGRQQLVYDDHRMLGSVGWAQQARSHDVALLKYTGDVKVHLGLAYHNSSLNSNIYLGPDAYKAMQYLWVNHKNDSYSASFLLMNLARPYWKVVDIEQKTNNTTTIGTHLKTTLGGVKLAGNLYYQFGENPSVDGADISAFNVSIDATAALSDKVNVGGGYELLSGTDQEGADKNNSFNPFFGTNHKFNGLMDYFFVGNHINNVGLHDIYVKANAKPGKVKFNAAIHFFSAHGEMTSGNQGLGTEVDLFCGYSHKGKVQLDFGYSHMFAGDGLYEVKGVENNDAGNSWAWVMLTFKPTLFESKKN